MWRQSGNRPAWASAVTDETIKLPALPGTALLGRAPKVALRFRRDYSPDRLTDREIDALCPVLPELASELLVLMAAENDKE